MSGEDEAIDIDGGELGGANQSGRGKIGVDLDSESESEEVVSDSEFACERMNDINNTDKDE